MVLILNYKHDNVTSNEYLLYTRIIVMESKNREELLLNLYVI